MDCVCKIHFPSLTERWRTIKSSRRDGRGSRPAVQESPTLVPPRQGIAAVNRMRRFVAGWNAGAKLALFSDGPSRAAGYPRCRGPPRSCHR